MPAEIAELTLDEIAARIPDDATIALTGAGIFLEPDEIFAAIERRFLETGHPRNLTLVHALGIGDTGDSGMNRFAHEGMVACVIGGHWSWSKPMQELARDNKIEAYSFPAGAISTLLREIGAKRPGAITRIGLGTFADPRVSGGRCNARAGRDLVEVVTFDGIEYLRYKPLKIDIAIVRGTAADPRGNITFHREPADLDAYAVALAAHNCGGTVYAQVEYRHEGRILPARMARLPGILVDAVAVTPDARKTYLDGYDAHLAGEVPTNPNGAAEMEMPTGVRRLIAERAAKEITARRANGDGRPCSVNFGYGIPGGIPALLHARDAADYWGTIEQGIHNGRMMDGPMFGSARDADAIIPSIDQFDFYSGGGIDMAFLGMGEMDEHGNVNVSMIGDLLVGPGGFVDITQTAREVVFCGTFEAKGLKVATGDGGSLTIERYGDVAKLVRAVRHITFSGPQARVNGQQVLYVTERAVFRLGPEDVELIELAPGIDLQRDVLDRMEFRPTVRL